MAASNRSRVRFLLGLALVGLLAVAPAQRIACGRDSAALAEPCCDADCARHALIGGAPNCCGIGRADSMGLFERPGDVSKARTVLATPLPSQPYTVAWSSTRVRPTDAPAPSRPLYLAKRTLLL